MTDFTRLAGIMQMPFPDNHDPRTDFVNRWPNLPAPGIMNDIRPQPENSPPLIRRYPDSTATIVNSLRGGNGR